MTYNSEEFAIYQEARELFELYRKCQSKADRMHYQRLKKEKEDREKQVLVNRRAAFSLDLENLRKDVENTIPMAYGDHSFTTQVRWSDNPDMAQLVIYFERKQVT